MYDFLKRAFDIVFALILMIVLVLSFPFVALGIKLSSKGPVLYTSTRIGRNGKTFNFYKFRSMHIDDGSLKGIAAEQKRIFTVGKILRRTKIDELPQALNVLKGDLSVVGPRPMLTTNVTKMYGGRYLPVMNVRPGLTSYASLFDYTHGDALVEDRERYRSEIVPIKREMELYYVQHRSISADIGIILRTAIIIISVIFGKKEFPYPKEYYIAKAALENEAKVEIH